MKILKNILTAIILISVSASCSDDDGGKKGSLQIEFANTVKGEQLALNTGAYINSSNETYTVKELKYIISNIVLTKENGEEFIYPVEESYFVINEENSDSKKVMLSGISNGAYTKIRFGIGVDQSKYPIESGTANFVPTAEDADMLWNWSAGYKFIKFEGTYTPESETESTDFLIHVGSHGANLDNYKEVELDLLKMVSINSDATASIYLSADISKIFDSVNTHSLQEKASVQIDPENAPKIAENAKTMFSIKIK